MTVVLNQAALTALLDAPGGPVQRFVQERAELAAAALQFRIDGIIENPLIRPEATVAMTDEGAVVGILDRGSVSDYMDEKLGIRENWWIGVGRAAAEA